MPFRTPSEREGPSQKGSDYADAVIEFMDSRGYTVDSRAEVSGESEDIIFEPKVGTKSPIVAEAKYVSPDRDGLSPNDYKEGFGKRFFQWKDGTYSDYDFYLFTTQVSNKSLWKDLVHRLKSDEIADFFDKVQANSEGELGDYLSSQGPAEFEVFLDNTTIWGGYWFDDLKRITERARQTQDFDSNPYLRSYDTFRETGKLHTNLLKVLQFPSTLYQFPAMDGSSTRAFYRHDQNTIYPVHFHEDTVYSLVDYPDLPDAAIDFIKEDSATQTDFEEFATKSPSKTTVNISKTLLKGVLTLQARSNDVEVTQARGETRIYYRHRNSDVSVDNKQLTKGLDTGEVRHRSIILQVYRLSGSYYFALWPTQEFTIDGVHLVSSHRKSQLSAGFSPSKYPQNWRKKQTVDIWTKVLSPSLFESNAVRPVRELSVWRLDPIDVEGIRPPKNGEEQTELVMRELAPGLEKPGSNDIEHDIHD